MKRKMKQSDAMETEASENSSMTVAQEKVNIKRGLKNFLCIAVIAIVLVGCGGGYYVFSSTANYFSTDNARVTAKMYNVMPVTTGKLLEWNVAVGDQVVENQSLGRQETLPYITAPISGTVVKNDGAENQLVNAAAPIAVIADSDNLYIGVNIEETDIMKIKVGQDVDVKLDAYPGETFKAKVTEIDPVTETFFNGASSFSTSGTYTKITQLIPVKVVLDNPENLPMTFGMNATVKIHLRTKELTDNEAYAAGKGNIGNGGKTTEKSTGEQKNSNLKTAEAIPTVAGKVAEVNVVEGQKVEAGDVLFTLDSTDLKLQLAQVEGSLLAAQATYDSAAAAKRQNTTVIPAQTAYDDAKANYDRLQTLYGAGAVSKNELDVAKSKVETTAAQLKAAGISESASYDNAAAQVQTAKAAYDIAKKKVEDCQVKAPIAGTIYRVNLEMGAYVSTQTPAMVIRGE